MGIRFFCPKGHKLNVKAELAGKIGICPKCGERMLIPFESTRQPGEKLHDVHQDPEREPDSGDVTTQSPPPEQTTAHLPDEGSMPQDLVEGQAIEEQTILRQVVQEQAGPNSTDKGQSPSDVILDPDASQLMARPSASAAPDLPSGKTVDSTSLLSDPSVLWYVRTEQGQTYGPAAGPVIQSWIQERRIGPGMLVWREGWSTWLEAKNVFTELERIFPATQRENPPVARESGPPQVESSEPGVVTGESAVIKKKLERKKKATRDLMIVLGLILAILALIVCLVLLLVWQRGQGGSETETAARVSSYLLAVAGVPFF